MASELVNSATSDKLTEMDWVKNIEICELVAHDHRQAKEVVKAIKKCLGSKNSNTQLLTVLLLEMLMNNIGEHVHQQVIDTGVLPILVKIVKKKSDLPVGEKIFLLLDASQTSLGGNSGRFPQYYSAYCELVSAGVQFPQSSSDTPKPHSASELSKNNSSNKQSASPQFERKAPQTHPQNVSGSSILQKAGTALEVLRDVLTAVDTQYSEGAKDEFTLDLVEQCSFHKQQVMHLAMTSRDDKVVTRAIELNEKLERILQRHDALVSGGTTLVATHIDHEQAGEEEEAEQLLQRIRKGKACLRPEEEDCQRDCPLRLKGHSVPGEMLHSPLIRSLTVERPKQEPVQPPTMKPMQETAQPLTVELNVGRPVVALPPPPAKPVERERFFRENKAEDSALNDHISSLSLHSRNGSSSRNASIDFSHS